jgi:diguanylate cyclase (GGDEF)-like protein
MEKYKRPLERSLVLTCSVFAAFMCVIMSLQISLSFTSWYYGRCEQSLTHIITSVEHQLDVDDLQQCVRTGVPSKKFNQLQQAFNLLVDDCELAYLYICIPRADGVMVSVCSATSAAERANGEEDWPLLNEDTEYYTPESIRPYLNAWSTDGITFFKDDSDWGECYTACKPIVASDGETVALLCADVFVDDLHAQKNQYIIRNVSSVVVVGSLFVALLLLWLRRDVTRPIEKLEVSTRNFASQSHGRRDPSMLMYHAPDINTHNEVESLSDAIAQMSEDMQAYMEDMVRAEERAKNAEEKAAGISKVAFEDPLTHAGSQVAYTQKVAELVRAIEDGVAQFAVLMVDLNNLKYINDTYGHDKGNRYLCGARELVSDAFQHSPVYRIGGDEFVVVVQGPDYEQRDELLRVFLDCLVKIQIDMTAQPWERFSAACGMASYEPGDTYKDVFGRADVAMYENKIQMKRAMGKDPTKR